jgi:hypothetical protein
MHLVLAEDLGLADAPIGGYFPAGGGQSRPQGVTYKANGPDVLPRRITDLGGFGLARCGHQRAR